MLKLSHIILFVVTGWCAFLLFWTSQSVHNKDKKLKELQQSSFQEQEYIRVLNSEWDYLNRPERIEVLAQKYFNDENFKSDSDSILISTKELKEPVVPSLPLRKPVMVHLTSSSSTDKRPAPKIITNAERQQFNDLMRDISSYGEGHD